MMTQMYLFLKASSSRVEPYDMMAVICIFLYISYTGKSTLAYNFMDGISNFYHRIVRKDT